MRVVAHLAPGGAQADAADAIRFGSPRNRDDRVLIHQRLRLNAGFVTRGLRAIGAVFGTGAGFDGDQFAHLHFVAEVMAAMHACGAEHQLEQRRVVNGANFLPLPIVSDIIRHRLLQSSG